MTGTDDAPWLRARRRPPGTSQETVDATGKLSEALEWVERARGRLYDFHQMIGHADFLLDDACSVLEAAGHHDVVATVREELIGRNVLEGRWTFQIVEEFDGMYWEPFRAIERDIREQLVDGARHVYESELKEQRRTTGRRHHESRPRPLG
jgi:hypothetical protein